MATLTSSELILNPDGSIYHLNLLPEDIADNIILAGDPDRVEIISSFFDTIEVRKRKREFVTHTGTYKGTRVTAISSGIGTDNIDIVLNELDALANIDLKTREVRKEHRALNLVRIGTSGSLQEDVPVDSFLLSELAIGFDGLLNFYAGRDDICDNGFERAFTEAVKWNRYLAAPYVVASSDTLFRKFSNSGMASGVTISAPGFYGPQGRVLRLKLAEPELNRAIEIFRYGRHRITNYEMESSAIYGLAKLLGHHGLTACAIIANRRDLTYSKHYDEIMKKLIAIVLEILVN